MGVLEKDDNVTIEDNTLHFIKLFVAQNTRLIVANYLNAVKSKPAEMKEMAKSVAFEVATIYVTTCTTSRK